MNASAIAVSLMAARDLVLDAFNAKVVPMLHSSPGMGKSSLIRSIAEEYNLFLIDIRLSTYDPITLNGYPSKDASGKSAEFLPFSGLFPLEDTPLPIRPDKQKDYEKALAACKAKNVKMSEQERAKYSYAGWLIFFDEISAAVRAIQAAAYGIILDGVVGQHKLHPNAVIAAAGNLITDNAVAFSMSTALQSRLYHIHISSHFENWKKEVAMKKHIDPRIVSYLTWKPEKLNAFDPQHTDITFACERTWTDILSPMIEHISDLDSEHIPRVAGAIGLTEATEFIAFNKYFNDLATFEDIINDPYSAKLPDSNPALYAMTGIIYPKITVANIGTVLRYVGRLPTEYQTVIMINAVTQTPALNRAPEFLQWRKATAVDLVL